MTGQPVGIGDRVEHEPLGLAHREADGVLAHLDVGVGGGELEVPRRAVGVLVVVQDRDGHLAVGVDLVDGDVVVHAHRVGQGRVLGDLDGDGAGIGAAAPVGDGVGHRVVALLVRQVEHQAPGTGGHAQRRVTGDRVALQGQGVAVGVQVVGQDVHGHGASGLGHDQVVGGHRGHVERGGLGDAHADRAGGLGPEAVLDDVGEGVGARGALGGLVGQPRGVDLHRAQGGGLVEAHQAHRVAVGVDAVQGHGDVGGRAGHGAGLQVAR